MGTSTIIRIDPVMDDWLLIVEREKPDFFAAMGRSQRYGMSLRSTTP